MHYFAHISALPLVGETTSGSAFWSFTECDRLGPQIYTRLHLIFRHARHSFYVVAATIRRGDICVGATGGGAVTLPTVVICAVWAIRLCLHGATIVARGKRLPIDFKRAVGVIGTHIIDACRARDCCPRGRSGFLR